MIVHANGKDMSTLKDLTEFLSYTRIMLPICAIAVVRRRLGMPDKPVTQPNRIAPRLKGRDDSTPVDFMNPEAGKRLGIFDHPQPGTAVMPPHKQSLAEVYKSMYQLTEHR